MKKTFLFLTMLISCLPLSTSQATEYNNRLFAADYPSFSASLDIYKQYINLTNGPDSCRDVYAFHATNVTEKLSMIYISCEKDASEWLIGIDRVQNRPIRAQKITIYGQE